MKSGMAALEEWLQQEYVSFFSDEMNNVENASNKPEFLASKIDDLFLKEDSSRNYVINGGRTYYLLNKSCTRIPKEVRDGLRGGDTTDVDNFIRLIDVYGITEDLKVFYIDTSSGTTYGNVENYKIDPALKSMKALGNSDVASQLSSALNAMGFGSTPDNITVGQISTLSNFTLNGQKENGEAISGLTDLSAISDATSLETLTLENLNLSSMTGLEKLTKLYYLYLRNVTCEDYSALCNLWELTHLFIYMPSATMDEATCNAQVINLGNGLENANKLTKLKNFGISGIETLFTAESLTFENNDYNSLWPDSLSRSTSFFTSDSKSNLSSLGTTTTGLGRVNPVIKSGLTFVLLNNNSISEIDALKDFTGIYQLHLMSNKNLYDISGISNHSTITYLTLQNCNLGALDVDGANDDYRASGLTGLQYLSIAKNSRLKSLQGLESSSLLQSIIGFGCDLTDISALGTYTYTIDKETGNVTTIIDKITNPHQNLSFLNLKDNSNLVSVDSIGSLTGLTKLYMQGCSSMDYDSTYSNVNKGIGKLTNTYVKTDGNHQILFLQLSNSYNGLDQKYRPLFENLMATQSTKIYFSTTSLKNTDGTDKILEDSDPLINAIKSRTDIELLDLGGQTSLNASTINTIISNNSSSLKYLSLKDLAQIQHFGDYEGEDVEWTTYRASLKTARDSNPPTADPSEPSSEGKTFLKTLPALDNCSQLKEIDIRGTSTHVSMRQITKKAPMLLIILDNFNINIAELSRYLNYNYSFSDSLYNGYYAANVSLCGDMSKYNFMNYPDSTIVFGGSSGNYQTGTIDLSYTTITDGEDYTYSGSHGVKWPKSLVNWKGYIYLKTKNDFSACSKLKTYYDECFAGNGITTLPSNCSLDFVKIARGYGWTYDLSNYSGITNSTQVEVNFGMSGGKCYLVDCGEIDCTGSSSSWLELYNLDKLKSSGSVALKYVALKDLNSLFYSGCQILNISYCDIKSLKFVKESVDAPQNTIDITLFNCTSLKSLEEVPDNLFINSFDAYNCAFSSDYMETLCSRFYRNGSLIINNFSLKSDSLASTATVGTQWVKPLLELHAAGLTSIKIGGKYVDSQAIEWLKNGVEIDGVEYAGFGASNVTIYN